MHVYAVPPLSQPDLVLASEIGLSLALHVVKGFETAALPGHAHEGLQQSQYRVETPVPDAALAPAAARPRTMML